MIGKPIFVVDNPGFMGLGGPSEHYAAHVGERAFPTQESFSCYVHRSLEGIVGYDIASWAAGGIRRTRRQPVVVIGPDGVAHEAVMVMSFTDSGWDAGMHAYVVAADEVQPAEQDLVCRYGGSLVRDWYPSEEWPKEKENA
jgi:hypothetical protein